MLILRSIDPAKRRFRQYVMSIQPGLFGDWCLHTQWGRIGSAGGQQKQYWYTSREEAEAQQERLLKRRSRRGYKHVGARSQQRPPKVR